MLRDLFTAAWRACAGASAESAIATHYPQQRRAALEEALEQAERARAALEEAIQELRESLEREP